MNTPVSLHIAKLLKEKGFNERCYFVYTVCGLKQIEAITNVEYRGYTNEEIDTIITAPTIAQVIMWLAGIHEFWINVFPYNDEELSQTLWENKIIHLVGDYNDYHDYTFYHTPTEAYEAAIEYCLLELIPNVDNT